MEIIVNECMQYKAMHEQLESPHMHCCCMHYGCVRLKNIMSHDHFTMHAQGNDMYSY